MVPETFLIGICTSYIAYSSNHFSVSMISWWKTHIAGYLLWRDTGGVRKDRTGRQGGRECETAAAMNGALFRNG